MFIRTYPILREAVIEVALPSALPESLVVRASACDTQEKDSSHESTLHGHDGTPPWLMIVCMNRSVAPATADMCILYLSTATLALVLARSFRSPPYAPPCARQEATASTICRINYVQPLCQLRGHTKQALQMMKPCARKDSKLRMAERKEA